MMWRVIKLMSTSPLRPFKKSCMSRMGISVHPFGSRKMNLKGFGAFSRMMRLIAGICATNSPQRARTPKPSVVCVAAKDRALRKHSYLLQLISIQFEAFCRALLDRPALRVVFQSRWQKRNRHNPYVWFAKGRRRRRCKRLNPI